MTQKLGKFKLGPAKTRDGRDAEIFKIIPEHDYPFLGVQKEGSGWILTAWYRDGKSVKFTADGYHESDGYGENDNLVPNAEPERVEFEGFGTSITRSSGDSYHVTRIEFSTTDVLPYLIGKRCKVTVEVLDG